MIISLILLKLMQAQREKLNDLKKKFEAAKINLRYFDEKFIGISLDETTTEKDVNEMLNIFGGKVTSSSSTEHHFPKI